MIMAKIDTSGWKPFVIGDLFDKLNLGIKNPQFNKALDVSEERTDEFNLPLVNAKHGNNGIMFYGRREDFETASMTIDIVQNGAIATGDVYAQPQETGVLWDAYLIKPKQEIKSENTLMFLAVVIERAIKERFSYDDKCVWDKASLLNVELPVDSHGGPDWASMDSFMSNVMKESEACLENLRLADEKKTAVDRSQWKRFHLYDDKLFDIDMGTKLDRVKMTEISPTINFVGRANNNNGITTTVDELDDIEPYGAGCMTLSLGGEYLGSCFIQPKPFYVSQNVVVLRPKWNMPFTVKQFIAAVVFRESRMYYKAFVDELNRHIRTDFSFYLPADRTGCPNWSYMDAYMHDAMQVAETHIEILSEL